MIIFYSKYKSLLKFGLVLIIITTINLISSNFFFRVDLSNDQIHSLSESTKETLENLNDIITAMCLVWYPEIEKLKKIYEKLNDLKHGWKFSNKLY